MMETIHDNMGNVYTVGAVYAFSDDINFSWFNIARMEKYDCTTGEFETDAERTYQHCRAVYGYLVVGTVDERGTIPVVGNRYMFLHAGKLKTGIACGDDYDLVIESVNDDGSKLVIDFIDCKLFTLIK